MKTIIAKILVAVLLLGILQSCKKSWLDAKPDKSLVIPNSIKDFQALLDNTTTVQFNGTQAVALGEIAAGDFYIQSSSWASVYSEQEKSAYIWADTKDFYKGEPNFEWSSAYIRILNTNVVLSGIEKVKPTNAEIENWNNVKGAALLYRAFELYNLSQQYCKPFLPSTSATDLGLPLRLDYDVNIPLTRSNLLQTYNQIINDLKLSAQLLTTTPLYKTRPSKQAAYGLLARTYLSMSRYDLAGLYADSALQIQSALVNYNTLKPESEYPFEIFNPETIFHSSFSYGILSPSMLIIDNELLSSYKENDLRRSLFFVLNNTEETTFRGSYNGDSYLFGGIATDEMYLIRAECNARNGLTAQALQDLNHLLRARWLGTYENFETSNPEVALTEILKERRKELIYRGLRWSDLRRLNLEERYKVTLSRTINGQTFTLLPNDPKYVFPIDETEIRMSGIQQNER